MKEQIEEMAKIIAVQRGYDCASNERCEESCIVYRCNPYAYAEILYNAGYRKQSEWISVDERLPEVAGREYLVWDDVQATVKKRFFYRMPPSIPVETYPHIREYFGNASDYRRYTHWMPLPAPPEMKGGE